MTLVILRDMLHVVMYATNNTIAEFAVRGVASLGGIEGTITYQEG